MIAAGQQRERAWLGLVLLLAAAVLWSLNGLFIKTLSGAGVGGWAIAGYRSLFAAVVLAPMAARRWRPIAEPGWVVWTVLAFAGMCATFVIATTITTAANAIILQYTAPAWVFVFAPLIARERANRHQLIGLLLSLLGVGTIFAMQFTSDRAGLVIGLSSGLVFGVQSVLFRRVRSVDAVVLTFLVCAGSGVLLLGVAAVIGRAGVSWPTLGWLAMMGVVQFGLPYVLFSMAIQRETAQRAVLVILIEAVLNPVWVWIFNGETPPWSTFVGGGFILASVAYPAIVRIGGSARRSGSAVSR